MYTCAVCGVVALLSPFPLSMFVLLQSEIGFRVTDAKKGVSVFWDLPKLEERLEQMRDLYQVRLRTPANSCQ